MYYCNEVLFVKTLLWPFIHFDVVSLMHSSILQIMRKHSYYALLGPYVVESRVALNIKSSLRRKA